MCCYFFYHEGNVGKLLSWESRDPVPSFWQLMLEVRDIPDSRLVPECLAVIPAVSSCFSENPRNCGVKLELAL